MIAVKNLSYQYPSGAVLNFPDWQTAKNEHALILGASGSGKTTFLHLLGGLLRPASGRIIIEGTAIQLLASTGLDRFRGAHIGFVFQQPHLLSSLTVRENVKLAVFLGKRPHKQELIDQVLEDLGIGDLANRKVHEISQGQAQRVAIARAVINRPDVILGDEPTASLDDESCAAVIRLLKDQADRYNATLIIATHDQRVKSEFQNRLML